MTHRERVLAALDHREPDRVPMDVGTARFTGMVRPAYDALRGRLGFGSRGDRRPHAAARRNGRARSARLSMWTFAPSARTRPTAAVTSSFPAIAIATSGVWSAASRPGAITTSRQAPARGRDHVRNDRALSLARSDRPRHRARAPRKGSPAARLRLRRDVQRAIQHRPHDAVPARVRGLVSRPRTAITTCSAASSMPSPT